MRKKNHQINQLSIRFILICFLSIVSLITISIELYNFYFATKYKDITFQGEDKDNFYQYKLDNIKIDLVNQLTCFLFDIGSLFFIHVLWDNWPNELLFTLVFYSLHYLITVYPFDYIKRNWLQKNYPLVKQHNFHVNFPPKNLLLYLGIEFSILFFEYLISKMTCLFKNIDNEIPLEEEIELTMDQDPKTIISNEIETKSCFIFNSYFWLVHFSIIALSYFCLSIIIPNMVNNNGSFKRVKDADLLKKVRKFTKRVGFPLSSLYVTLSKEDPPNAFVLGIFEKRVIITKALFEMETFPELASIVAHEVGHWYHSDLISGYFMTVLPLLILSILIQFISFKGLEDFDFKGNFPLSGIILISMLYFQSTKVIWTPFSSSIMRLFERRADCFSSSFQLPIGQALLGLSNLSSQKFTPSPIYRWFYFSHPTVPERLENLNNCKNYNWNEINISN